MQLVVENSYTYLNEVESNDYVVKLLDKFLRYRPEGYMFSPAFKKKYWDGYNRCFDKKQLRFQTGLLEKVSNFLQENQISFEVIDIREEPLKRKSFNKIIDLPPLRNYQKEAVENFIKEGRGIINIPTGAGKTFIATEIIDRMKLSTLFVAPNIMIMKQVADILTEIFGKSYVGVIYGKRKQKNKPITVACVTSLSKLPKEFFDKFDLLVIDEFHRSAAKTYLDLNKQKFNNIFNRLGLTATFYRNDGADMDMQGVLSNVVFKMDVYEAIQKGYLVKPYFFIQRFKHHKSQWKQWQKVYKEHIVENVERNQIIIDRTKYFQKKNKNILVLIQEIEHGNYLQSKIPNSVFIHGNTENRQELIEDFRNGKIKTVIGSNIFSEGSDIPLIDVVILAQGRKAESDLIQKIGRALRLYEGKKKAIIFDILDENQITLEKQAKSRIETYKKHYKDNIKIVK